MTGYPLNHHEELPVRAEGDRGAAGAAPKLGEKCGRVLDLLQVSVVVETEADDTALAARVHDVDEVAMLRHRYGGAAAGWSFTEQVQIGILYSEDGNSAASRVGGEEKSVILAEGKGALRSEGSDKASAAAATGVESIAAGQFAVAISVSTR